MLVVCVCMVSFSALLFFISYYFRHQLGWEADSLATMCFGFVFLVCSLAGFAYFFQSGTPDTYYLPCEIVSVNETSTYFGTVDQDIQMIYAAETGDHDWPDDVPYLLCMDSMGTKDITDDEILVVWRTD